MRATFRSIGLPRRVEPVSPRKAPPRRVPITRKPVSRASALRTLLQQNLLVISSVLLLVGISGWGLALYSEFRASGLIGSSSIYAETTRFDSSIAKSDPFAMSTYAPSATLPRPTAVAPMVRESASNIIARDWSYFEPKRIADVPREPATPAKVPPPLPPPPRPGAHRFRRPGPHCIH